MKKFIKKLIGKIKPTKKEDVKPTESKENNSAPLYQYRMNK